MAPETLRSPLVQLGRALFWDTRLSADGQTACASCHLVEDWGSDRRVRPLDARGKPTKRHSQSVLNAQQATAGLRWVADRPTGAEQALGSITGSMGFDSREVMVSVLHAQGYAPAFAAAFPNDAAPVSAEHYADALQAYQETLRTPAPFDAWLGGDDAALNDRELRGLQQFIATGCGGCHAGPLLGGGALQRFGVVADYRPHTGSTTDDTGLMQKTGSDRDKDIFRVQPLRNVAKTAPYFHDGSVSELSEAVAVMGRVQLGQTLPEATVDEIVDFLGALTGDVPAHFGPPAAETPYRLGTPSIDGIGKFYMGREISHVMGHRGAAWLERGAREREERTDLLVARLPLAPDDVVADIGAGTGFIAFQVAERVPEGRVLAVDIQPEMLSIVEARARREGIDNVETVLGTVRDPRLPKAGVDLVYFVDAYHEFEYPKEMGEAIASALRPGGKLVLIEYRGEDPAVPIKPLHKMTAQQVINEMQALGLRWVETADYLPQQHVIIFEAPNLSP